MVFTQRGWGRNPGWLRFRFAQPCRRGVPRDLIATSLGRVDREGARDLTDIEQGVEHAAAVECGLPGGFGQSGVDDRRDRGFRRRVADGSAHAVEEIEGIGPGHELMAGCATDGRVHQCDERRLANRLYVALMLVPSHDEITAVGVDGIAVLLRGTRSASAASQTQEAPTPLVPGQRGGTWAGRPIALRSNASPACAHLERLAFEWPLTRRFNPRETLVKRAQASDLGRRALAPRTFGVAAAEQNGPAVSSG